MLASVTADQTPDALELRRRILFSDEQLFAECAFDTYRASGPGGQKRNKTSSAVRLRHRLSGLTAIGEESRSQHENRAKALERLRESFALQVRIVPPTPPAWPHGVVSGEGRLRVGKSNKARTSLVADVLDALDHFGGRLPETAKFCAVTSSSLLRFLADEPRVWAVVQRIRQAHGQPPLKPPG